MGSIPARSESFTDRSYNLSAVETTTTYYTNGTVQKSQSAHSVLEHRCSRSGKSKNSATPVAGSSTMFKSPSSYAREIMEVTHHSGAWERNFTGLSYYKQIIEGVPRTLAANTQYRILPCWGGGHQVTVDSNLQMQARVQAMLKLADGKADIGVALAESRRTYNMLASRSMDLLQALLDLKRRRFRNPRDWNRAHPDLGIDTRRLADGYLEYKYGWRPLMKDLHDIYGLFRDSLKPALLVDGQATIPDNATYSGSVHNSRYYTSGSARRWHRCHVWGAVDSSSMRQMTQVGLTNPLALAWEVVPYSFVVDWFMPIGNVLEAHAARLGLTFVGGYDAVKSEGTCTARLLPPTGTIEISERYHEASHFGYRRWKLTSWPTLGLYAKTDPFNTSMAASAAALWRQQFK